MPIESPALPYDFSELEPAMSRDSVVFHFLRHQRVCFDRMRALARDTGLGELSLEELIRVTEKSAAHRALYCCAAEVWNHNLFWRSMRPRGGGAAHGLIATAIAERFGSFERFTHTLKAAVSAHFGSGWLWLVWRSGAVEILVTQNAVTPLTRGDPVLLALDLWEHAYYLDHQNRRAAYVTTYLEELVSWDFANGVLEELRRCPPRARAVGDKAAPRALRPRAAAAARRARTSP
jgi:superoxide dismutase, Fe-Mn family